MNSGKICKRNGTHSGPNVADCGHSVHAICSNVSSHFIQIYGEGHANNRGRHVTEIDHVLRSRYLQMSVFVRATGTDY